MAFFHSKRFPGIVLTCWTQLFCVACRILKLILTTPENSITYHNAFCLSLQNKHCFQFLLEPFYLPRETEDNASAKFWGDKQRALWYAMVFSVVVN